MSTTSKSSQWYSGFEPRNIPNCVLWLDGDDTSKVSLTSGAVTTWIDKSRTSTNATGISATAPTYTATQNGRRVLSFSGFQYLSFGVTNMPQGTSEFSVFLVGRTTTNTTQHFLRWGDNLGPSDTGKIYRLYILNTNNGLYQDYFNAGGSSTTTNIINSYFIFSHTATTTSNNPFLNGTAFTTIATYSYNLGSAIGAIGSLSGTSPSNGLIGDIGEILIYNRSLTTTERQQVEGYLGWKWGLQSNFPTLTPLTISNNVLWLDASDSSSVIRSGSNVTGWNDKSTSANNATNGGIGTYPTYTQTQNGKNVISFDGASQFLSLTSSKLPNGTASFSVFLVGRSILSSASVQYIFRWGVSTIGGSYQLITTKSVSNITLQQDYSGSTASTDNTNVNGSYFILSNVSTTSATAPHRNGTIFTSLNNYSYNINATGGTSFIGSLNGSQFFLNGNIGEIIVYNRALTTNERQQIETYLSNKWNISTAVTVSTSVFPYGTRPPFLTAFIPTDLSNCGLWLDALDAKTVSGTTNVTAWNDKSGNGRNVTATNGPSYSSDTIIFPGINGRFLENTAWNNFNRIDHTLIAVHRPDTSTAFTGNTRLFSIQQNSGTPYVVFPYLNNTTPNGYINDGSSSTQPASSGKTLLDNSSTSNYNIITASISGTSQAIYNNGTLQDSRTFTITANTVTSGVKIGGQFSENYKGSVKEIIIYTRALNATEIQIIEGYLAWKWGYQTLLPSTHSFRNFPPLKAT